MQLQVWPQDPWTRPSYPVLYVYAWCIPLRRGSADGQQLEEHLQALFTQRWSEAWLRPGPGCESGFSCALQGLDHSLSSVADLGLAGPTAQGGWSQQTPDSYHLSAESGTRSQEASSSKAARWTSDEDNTAYPTDSREIQT